MNPPMTPHTPGLQPSGGPAAGRRSPSAISGAGTARRPQPLGHPNLHRQVPYAISSPSPPGSAMTRIRPFGEVFAGGPPSISEAEYRARMGSQPVSPDPKRRRYNGPGVAVPGRDVHMTSPTGLYQHGHQHSPKRMSLPRPGDGTVHARYATQGYQQRPGYRYVSMDSRDPSLTLAPLQRPSISSDSTASGPKRVGSVASAECQIMSIPAINKLRLLSKAAPPLPYPGTSDTGTETTRGAILAIEGSEEDVRQVSEWLAEFLKTQSKEFLVRAFLGPDISAVMVGAKSDEEVDMVGTQQQRYLKAISEWHWVSKEVVRYVTSMPEPPTPQRQQPRSEKQKKEGQAEEREEREGEEMDVDTTPSPSSHPSSSSPSPTSASVSVVSPVSPRTITQTERLSLQNNNPPKTKSDKTPIPSPQPTTTDNPVSTRPFPIALLPRYQLSTVDTASLAMPITDSYAPTDHWQWAAALWRGCVGPDVTIVVQEAAVGASGSVGGGGGGNGVSGVEVRLGEGDVRAVVVRKGGSNGGGGSGIEPFLLRRVGFEIVEFLRK